MVKNERVCNLWWTILLMCNAHQNIAGDVEHASTSLDNCCGSFNITTSLADQNGVYKRCFEESCKGKTIYHYKNGNDISTLIRDENTEHEWNIYKGSLYEAKDDSVVIYTGCKEDCPTKCNGTGLFQVHNYIKEVFEPDQSSKISCIENIESNYIGTWIAAIVILILICVALLVTLYFREEILVWVQEKIRKLGNGYSESKQEDVENPGFSVSIKGNNSELLKNEHKLKLPQNQVTLNVVCDPPHTEYFYNWSKKAGNDWIELVCSKGTYTTKPLPEGLHKFKVIVNHDEKSIKKIISVNVYSDVTVKSRGNETNTEYKASKAEMDTKIWIGNDAKIHSLPPSLSESIVFLLPYELSKSSSNLSISVKYPSIIYIGYAPNEVKNYSYGWTKRSFSKMGFEEVKRERNNSNDVKIKHHLYGICSFTLFRKSLDGENLEYELQEADTLNANVVIFVVEGNLEVKESRSNTSTSDTHPSVLRKSSLSKSLKSLSSKLRRNSQSSIEEMESVNNVKETPI